MRYLKGTKTAENLKHGFCGEAMTNKRYLYFVRRAIPRWLRFFNHRDFFLTFFKKGGSSPPA